MGKSKTRILRKGINDRFLRLSREDALFKVSNLIESDLMGAKDIISMFGLSADELLEYGVSYESVKAIKSILL